MKHLLLIIILFAASSAFGQKIYTRNDSIPITQDSVTILAGPHQGNIQWQESLDGESWINLDGKNTDSIKVNSNDEAMYRAVVTEGTCAPVFSDTAKIVISNNKISGKIILPDNSSVDLNTLTVSSPTQESSIKNGDFELDSLSISNYSTQFVTGQDGELLMMGYHYPGQKNNDISAESTALAILMNTPTIQALTDDGKQNFINEITLDSSFVKLVDEINNSLKIGNSVLDTTNLKLRNSILNLYNIASTKSAKTFNNNPISIYVNGRQIILVNNGVACSFIVGVYKDGVLLNTTTIDGLKMFAYSYKDVKNQIFHSTEVIQKIIKLDGDGNFDLKIRSGSINDHTFESNLAYKENRNKYIIEYLSPISSIIPESCAKAVTDNISEFVRDLVLDPPENTNFSVEEASNYFINISYGALKIVVETVDQCGAGEAFKDYLKSYSKLLSFVTILSTVGAAGGIINATARVYHYVNSKSIIDTCFVANREIVSPCNFVKLTTYDATSITQNTAISGGYIINDGGLPIVSQGVCCNLTGNPTIGDQSFESLNSGSNFTSYLFNLKPGTEYFVRAYLVNKEREAYGNEIHFTTLKDTIPQLTTSPVTSITQNSAVTGGTITSDGGTPITAKGVCWSLYHNPTIELNTKSNEGTGTDDFVSSIADLIEDTTYFVRAYAANSTGTAYGDEVSFRTKAEAAKLIIQSGNNQFRNTAGYLPENLKVKLTDAANNPIEGTQIKWEISSGKGKLDHEVTITDVNGETENRFFLDYSNEKHDVKVSIIGKEEINATFLETLRLIPLGSGNYWYYVGEQFWDYKKNGPDIWNYTKLGTNGMICGNHSGSNERCFSNQYYDINQTDFVYKGGSMDQINEMKHYFKDGDTLLIIPQTNPYDTKNYLKNVKIIDDRNIVVQSFSPIWTVPGVDGNGDPIVEFGGWYAYLHYIERGKGIIRTEMHVPKSAWGDLSYRPKSTEIPSLDDCALQAYWDLKEFEVVEWNK